MKYKISLLILALLASFTIAKAQTITGVVTDNTGEPLIGVAVVVDGTTIGASTDLDGYYSLDVPDAKGKTLVFSFIGLRTDYVVIGDSFTINHVMEDDDNFLEETVVIGYATVKRKDLMGSVTSVDSKALTQVPVTTVGEALSGKMAGVQVTTTEGDPDADIKIRVRGTGSITQDSSPLYIVDGFPVESISDIAASDIQSIDVLKDAFSTAIYGSRGANGVVLVTTKSGEKGKFSVNYNVYWGQKWMANKNAIQVLDTEDYVKARYEIAAIRDNVDNWYVPYFGLYSDIGLYAGVEGNDWIDQVFGNTGRTFSHNISLSGSTDKVKWTASYSHMGEKAIMTGSDYKRDNLSLKAQYNPIKQLTFDFNVRYSRTKIMGSGSNSVNDSGSTSGNGRLKHAVQYSPIPLSGAVSGSDLEEDYGDNAQPLLSVADNDNKRIRTNYTINGSVTYHIIDNLNLKIEGGLDDYDQKNDRFYGLTTYYVGNSAIYSNHPANQYTDTYRQTIRSTNTLSYNFSNVINNSKHSVDMLFGHEFIVQKSNELTVMVENFPDFFTSEEAWDKMATGTVVSSDNYYDPDDRLLSFFARFNYAYDSRYSLSATVRADGSSKFAKGHQWGVFPSAAASWTISNEHWMDKSRDWLDNLKLRYSFGTAGNNNIPSGVMALTYAANNSTWISQGDTYLATSGSNIMANPDLTWETTLSHNVGIDFSFWRSRLSGSIEGYHNTTKNLLIEFPVSGTGYSYQYQNMGTVTNQGLELSLNAVIVESKNVSLTFGGNISVNKNRVKSLGGLDMIESSSGWASTEIAGDYRVTEGQPLGNMYGYVSDGFYTVDDFTYNGSTWVLNDGVPSDASIISSSYLRPGAMKLKDLNGDGVVDTNDRQVIGNAMPVGSGGFNINLSFYGFDFVANFNYVFGNDIYNANKIEFTSQRKDSYRTRNFMKTKEQRWTNIDWNTGEVINDPEQLAAVNANATLWSAGVGNAVFSDWAVEDGSFLRLTSATLGYTLPENITKKFLVQRLRVYVTGTNLFCATKYSGYDPEVDTRRATPLTPGVDYSAYPKSIGFVIGANVTF
ncbi:MAG: TonB-dependent receptor [Bacteroidales bacterium]|nr:TonB-dependent receptor [Bacteroidales bacterium]